MNIIKSAQILLQKWRSAKAAKRTSNMVSNYASTHEIHASQAGFIRDKAVKVCKQKLVEPIPMLIQHGI